MITADNLIPIPNINLGSLEAYIQSVNSIPMLPSAKEEHDLACLLQNKGDLSAASRLILSHLRLVVSIARQYLGYGLPHADLIQEGNIGLMKAVKRFEPSQCVRLASYAIYWIKAEIHEYILKNWRIVRIATTKAQRKLFFNLRSYKSKLTSLNSLEIEDIAQKLKVRPKDVLDMEVRISANELCLEDNDRCDNSDISYAPIHYLTDLSNEPLQKMASKAKDKLHGEDLLKALDCLDSRSREIISSRWLVDSINKNNNFKDNNEQNCKTLQQLAKEFDVSAERIRQIENTAFKKMRAFLEPIANS